jgi:NTE family protein
MRFKSSHKGKFHRALFSGLRILAAGILVLSMFFESNGQELNHRPTVGLVLSGGAAHGIAHLGVLKVMEEAGLRPDYITGVSMGSIIGGLYSMGYSADSIIKIFKTVDWNMMFTGKIPENKVIFLEKDNFHNSIVSLPTSSRRLNLPSGLINGQQIENMLSYYFWPAADLGDFSRLPIPFMCVATDILNYKKIDLKKGYLPDAIRASTAVPSIFTPIKVDSLLLVDGGLLHNFAASEAKEMGAEILIGSYAGFHPYTEEELQNVSDIIKQIAFYRSLEDFNEEKKYIKILVTHNLRNIPKTGFGDVDSLVSKGYAAAQPFRESFRRLADSLNNFGVQKPLKNILIEKNYRFDRIDILGNQDYSDEQIRGLLDISPGDSVSRESLGEKMDLLYGKSWFEKVKYRIVPRNDSLVLVIDCIERSKGMLYGSVHYDNALKASMVLGMSVKNLLTNNSIININAFIAQYFRFDFNATQFVDPHQKLGFSASFYAENTLIPRLQISAERGNVISRNMYTTGAINRYIGLNQMVNISLKYENRYLIPQFDFESHLKRLSYNYLTESFNYMINTLDSRYFPTRGLKLDISASTSKLLSAETRTDSSKTVVRIDNSGLYESKRFHSFHGNIRYFIPVAQKVTLSLGGNAVTISSTDSLSARGSYWTLGGIEATAVRSFPLYGYHANEIAVRKMVSAMVSLDIEFLKDLHLELTANEAVIDGIDGSKNAYWLGGYGLNLGYMSIIGPIRLGVMYGDRSYEISYSRFKGFISIGYRF